MSTIKSSAENLTLNADGANNDVIIQSNGSTKVHIDGTGKVGIGTTTPQTEMHVVTANTSLVHIGGAPNANGNYQGISLGYSEVGNTLYRKVAVVSAGINDSSARQTFHVLVDTASDSGSTQLVDSKFSVSGTTGICQARNGLTFGSDTAAANALDDYEEGTCTLQYSDGSAGVGSANNGTYTKVGRMVTVSGDIIGNVGSLTSSAALKITGFPFAFSKAGVGPFLTRNFQVPDGTVNVVMYHGGSGTQAELYSFIDHGAYANALVEDLHASTNDIYFTLTYQTSA